MKDLHVRAVSVSNLSIPFYFDTVSAGFPSPADDYVEARLSLDELVITNPSSTFFVKVEGYSMKDAGIYPGDVLVVDKSQMPSSGDVIIAVLDGEFTVKRYVIDGANHWLKPENSTYKPIRIDEYTAFSVWGKVIAVIHDPREL